MLPVHVSCDPGVLGEPRESLLTHFSIHLHKLCILILDHMFTPYLVYMRKKYIHWFVNGKCWSGLS